MAEIDVLKAMVVRQNVNQAWGFRLQGGVDLGEPLKIARITPGSPAASVGLRANDVVTEISDFSTDQMTCQQANELVIQHGDSIVLTVERRAHGYIPTNPVLNQTPDTRVKDYQTLDMTGSGPRTGRRVTRPANYVAATSYYPTQQPTPPYSPSEDVGFPALICTHKPATEISHHQPDTGRTYQPNDLTGNRWYPQASRKDPRDFQVAVSRPFDKPPAHQLLRTAPAPHPETYVEQPQYHNTPYSERAAQYYSQNDTEDAGVSREPQSRTFKRLESVMQGNPMAGERCLPPPRSASREQQHAEEAAKRQRVKVFMPQQYNSPLGMYSAHNVVQTFKTQAESMFDTLERRQQPGEEYQTSYDNNINNSHSSSF